MTRRLWNVISFLAVVNVATRAIEGAIVVGREINRARKSQRE